MPFRWTARDSTHDRVNKYKPPCGHHMREMTREKRRKEKRNKVSAKRTWLQVKLGFSHRIVFVQTNVIFIRYTYTAINLSSNGITNTLG